MHYIFEKIYLGPLPQIKKDMGQVGNFASHLFWLKMENNSTIKEDGRFYIFKKKKPFLQAPQSPLSSSWLELKIPKQLYYKLLQNQVWR